MLSKEETNIFKGICTNKIFWIVIAICFIGQICFIQYGGRPTRSSPLPLWMHVVCLLLGMLSMVFNYINKCLGDDTVCVPEWLKGSESENEVKVEDIDNGHVSSLRRPFSSRVSANKPNSSNPNVRT